MATYSAVSASEKDTDSPITTGLIDKLDQNPHAIAEGVSGAPKIANAAFSDNTIKSSKIQMNKQTWSGYTWTGLSNGGSPTAYYFDHGNFIQVFLFSNVTPTNIGSLISITLPITVDNTGNVSGYIERGCLSANEIMYRVYSDATKLYFTPLFDIKHNDGEDDVYREEAWKSTSFNTPSAFHLCVNGLWLEKP